MSAKKKKPKNDLFQLPTASSGLGPGGVDGRDAKIRDEKIERQRRSTIRKLDRQIRFNSGRRGNPNLLAALNEQKKSLGGDLLNVGSVGIPNTKDLDNQARIDSDDQARKRWKIAQAQAGKNQAKNGGDGQQAGGDGQQAGGDGQQAEGGGGQPAVGEGQAEDEVEEEAGVLGYDRNPPERESQREAREATERVKAAGGFGDQKKQEAFSKRFGGGAPSAKQRFLEDLERSDLIKASRGMGEGSSWDPNSKEVKDAQEKAYKRADELGVTREKLQVKMGWETDAEAAEETRKASAIRDVQEKAEQKQRISDEFDADLEDRIERMKADPGYKPLISQEIHDILDPKRIQELQDETDSSVKEARTNTEMVEARSHLQMEEVRNEIARKKKMREEQKQKQKQEQEQKQQTETETNPNDISNSDLFKGYSDFDGKEGGWTGRNEMERRQRIIDFEENRAWWLTLPSKVGNIVSSDFNKLFENGEISGSADLSKRQRAIVIKGIKNQLKREKRDQASQSLKKEVADASKPAQQQ